VDLDDALPLYAQIERQVRGLLASGHWQAGDRLPSVRETAGRLRVNPLTVAKAYGRLEDDGLLEARPGSGVFAAEPKAPLGPERRQARKRLEAAVTEASLGGLAASDIEEVVRRTLQGTAAWK
jgi:DNA-binding transcriptional regulator YhcF (GntR family)